MDWGMTQNHKTPGYATEWADMPTAKAESIEMFATDGIPCPLGESGADR